MMDSDELRGLQAKLRLEQRKRIDEMHALCHEALREDFWQSIGGKPRRDHADMFNHMHALVHKFMRDMDNAILIHRRIAEIEGRDPGAVDGALWPVRTQPPATPQSEEKE